MTLNYADDIRYINVAAAAYTQANFLWRANSVYDPDKTGTGHQPMGFDQWMALYSHFRVLGSKITCRFIFDKTDDFQGAVGIALIPTTTVPGHTDMIENKRNLKYKGVHQSTTANRDIVVSKTFSPRKFFGPRSMTINQYGGVASNPVEDAYFATYAYRRWAVGAAHDVLLAVRISYYVEFSEPLVGLPS